MSDTIPLRFCETPPAGMRRAKCWIAIDTVAGCSVRVELATVHGGVACAGMGRDISPVDLEPGGKWRALRMIAVDARPESVGVLVTMLAGEADVRAEWIFEP